MDDVEERSDDPAFRSGETLSLGIWGKWRPRATRSAAERFRGREGERGLRTRR